LEHLTALTLSPSYMNHQTQIVLARQLFVQTAQGDEPEEIEVVPWKLSQLAALLQRDDCTEARSIAALFMVRELLSGGTK
jgi:ADP-ribose diphosphatase